MTRLKKLGQAYWLDESGATAIEYALIAAVVAIALIGGASSIGKNTNSLWNGVSEAVAKAG